MSIKNIPISQTEGYFENPLYRFLEEPMPMLFLLALKRYLSEKCFPVLRQKLKTLLKEQSFLFTVYLMNHIFQTPVLLVCDNGMYKT